MPKEEKKKVDFNSLLPVIIPAIVAIIVVVALAISGNITKHRDIKSPTGVTQAVVESTTQPRHSRVTLVAVGDNYIHNTIISAGKQADGTLNYNSLYENVKPYIESADLAVVNQESILGGAEFDYSGYPMFNSPWEIGDALISTGFDVFTCATEHAMDVGSAGIIKECDYFNKHKDVTQIGTYDSEEEYSKIAYVESKGITFAMLNYTFGTNGIPIPEDKPFLVSVLSEEKVKKDVAIAKEHSDVVVAFTHFGTENTLTVNETQRKYVKLFNNLGVDVVIGTHTHTVQPVEWIENEKNGNKTLVYYSLGNFMAHQVSRNQLLGGVAEIEFEKNSDGVVEISSAKLVPVVDFCKKTDAGYEFSVYKLKDYTEDIASQQSLKDSTPEYFEELAKELVAEEFLKID